VIVFTPGARPLPGSRFVRITADEAEVLTVLREPGRFNQLARNWIAATVKTALRFGANPSYSG
jgi:hypothetical protein